MTAGRRQQDDRVAACDGLVVIDLSEGMSGALATMVLADHGATVIKLESPAGDWARRLPGWSMWNRGKQSVVVDWASAAGRLRAFELIQRADVLVDTMTEAAARDRGLSRAALIASNPRLVQCSISALGPAADVLGSVPAYDGIVSAVVGRMAETELLSGAVPGQDRDWPIFTAPPTPSYGAAQLALQGILAALLSRQRTGRGDHVRTSLAEGWVAFMMRHEMARDVDAELAPGPAPAEDLFMRALHLCYLTAECADGRYVQMCARQEHHFRAWLRALGLHSLVADPAFAHAPFGLDPGQLDDLERLLRDGMRRHTQQQWIQAFTADFDVGGDPFLEPPEFLAHPQMLDNERVVTLADPERGPTVQVGALVAMSKTPAVIRRPAPRLGEHGELAQLRPLPAAAASAAAGGRPGLPLAGVTIIETAYFVAGPLATALLAELGARVIKVEPLAGDPFRRAGLQAVKFMHGKESIAVDLKDPAGTEILDRLVARADAFVHSFRPGVPDRLGVDYARLRAINERLIYLNASSYGARGPQKHRVAFHSTPTALTGAGFLQAGDGNPPVDDSFPDPASGLGAASALMLGLWAREQSGHGQYLETTMLASTGYVMSNELTQYAGLPPWRRNDRGQHGLHPLYRLYRCRSGWLFLAAVGAGDRSRLVGALGLADSPGTIEQDEGRLADLLAERFASRPAGEWVDALTAARVPAVEVTGETAPQWLARAGLLTPAEHAGFGRYWRLPPKLRFETARTAKDRPPAATGEHTGALLAELGFAGSEVADLMRTGVVLGDPGPGLS